MPKRRHVDAYLMGAARLDADVQQRELSERRPNALPNLVVSYGCASAMTARRHADAPHCVAGNRCVDGPRIFRGPAMDQRYVTLLHLPAGELLCQLAMRKIILRHNDQAAGFLVQTMHDSRPHLAAHYRQAAKAMQQRIDQRAAIALVISRA